MPRDKYGFDTEEDQGSFSTMWCWSAAFLFTGLAALFILFPRLLLFLATTTRTTPGTSLSPLEYFLALHFGIFLISFAFVIILNIPSDKPVPSNTTAVNSSVLIPVSSASLLSALLAYNAHGIGPLSHIVFVVNAMIGMTGLWTVLFTESAPRSAKTGADKHTSSFIFGNTTSASKIKEAAEKKGE